MIARNRQKALPCNGLVWKSPTMRLVGQYSTLTLPRLYMIMNEIISDLEMTSLLATGLSSGLLQKHCTLIILVNDVIYHVNALGFQKYFTQRTMVMLSLTPTFLLRLSFEC